MELPLKFEFVSGGGSLFFTLTDSESFHALAKDMKLHFPRTVQYSIQVSSLLTFNKLID